MNDPTDDPPASRSLSELAASRRLSGPIDRVWAL